MWDFPEDKAYQNRPTTVEELKRALQAEIGAVLPELCRRAAPNVISRLRELCQAADRHFENIVR